MHWNGTTFAALYLLAAGCATAGPPKPATGEPQPPEQANIEACDSVLEREYTPAFRSAGVEGEVRVWIHVDEKGIVRDVRIGVSSGHSELDRIALRVARCSRFVPALNRGVPVPVWIQVPIYFRAR